MKVLQTFNLFLTKKSGVFDKFINDGGDKMPKEKPLKGVSKKEQRMYEHIKESAKKSGKYGKRYKEVAARTVMKHHKEKGHDKNQ